MAKIIPVIYDGCLNTKEVLGLRELKKHHRDYRSGQLTRYKNGAIHCSGAFSECQRAESGRIQTMFDATQVATYNEVHGNSYTRRAMALKNTSFVDTKLRNSGSVSWNSTSESGLY